MCFRFLKYCLALTLLLAGMSSYATHNRAGEITYRHINGLQYEITITTCTKTSAPADRPYLHLKWGDEGNAFDLDSLERFNDPQFVAGQDAQINVYKGLHTYPGNGTYVISVEDPNRNGLIKNIPVSVNQVFYIESELIIKPDTGPNSSVTLLNNPKEQACLYQYWIHNPGAYDPDGDSLVFSLVPCRGNGGQFIDGYKMPDDSTDDPSDEFYIDSQTGDVIWANPEDAGEFNIAILIQEYRKGEKVGSVIRDMQILVETCNNQPPVFDPIPDICVVEGEFVGLSVNVIDPDGDNFILEAIGPMIQPGAEVENAAIWNPTTGNFSWQPLCPEVRLEPYQVLFKAIDSGNQIPLTGIESVFIQVIAGPVENIVTESTASSISLTWDTHNCADELDDPDDLIYKIYKRLNIYGYDPGECETGVPSYTGYELIETTEGADNTSFLDLDVEQGFTYCYIITICLPDGSESVASEEICTQLLGEAALLTQASVVSTDPTNGEVEVKWIEPQELDTLEFPSPYEFKLYYTEGQIGGSEELLFTSPSFDNFEFTDLVYSHTGLNTQDVGHRYRIELFSNGISTGQSPYSSSIFLTLVPNDNQLTLNYLASTNWVNQIYDIYKLDPVTSNFVLIGSTNETSYVDEGLNNNQEYCYYVTSTGEYATVPEANPIVNDSQIACGVPYDYEAPCAPEIEAFGDCIVNETAIYWTNPNLSCADDVTAYNLYYTPIQGGNMTLLETFESADDLEYFFSGENTIAGCWYVTALDSLNPGPNGTTIQNESVPSETVCADNCPIYELPNVYSPNQDGFNDLFVPIELAYVDSVDFTIFNRWGEPIWKTTDPELGWDGTRSDNGELVSDGTYYYGITIYTIRLVGIVEETQSGFITLLGGSKSGSE